MGADSTAPNLLWSKPLGDPFGGTKLANGRHPVKMFEPTAAADAPKEVVYLILGSLQFSEAALRVYGHPELLAVAAAINGPDFTPFNEALFIKEPGRGASVAWHQDGTTHWDSPRMGPGRARLQFHGPALWLHGSQRRLGRAGLAQARQDRHRFAGGQGRQRAAARRRADDRPAGRRRHHQPPGAARLLRQHQPRLAGHGEFRLPSPQVGAGRAGRRRAQRGRRLRRRTHSRTGTADRLRHRRPPATFSRREVIRLQAACRGGASYRWDDKAKAEIKDYNLLDLSI